MHKHYRWYSQHPKYRDLNLTYKKTIAAYDGLIALDLTQETQRGHFNRETLEGSITHFTTSDDLLSLFSEIKEHPFGVIKLNPGA